MTNISLASGLLRNILYLSKQDQEVVQQAALAAIDWHGEQKRQSGEPYVQHPIAVAEYLTQLQAGRDTLVAALLHDVAEDGCATLEEIEAKFGTKVAALVDGVTKLSKLEYEGKRHKRQLASLRKMLLSAHDDLRVIFIKLADRWHNINTLDAVSDEKKQRVARETLEIYVPFARLVGLWSLKSEFENICFPIVHPKDYATWKEEIEIQRTKLQPERKKFVQNIDTKTQSHIQAYIDEMTVYEAFIKLQGNLSRLHDARNIDTILLRIAGENNSPEFELECYKSLGEIHQQYPVLTASFRDYISSPQPNGYKALHTTIFLSQNHLARLRIQTEFMYQHANKRRLVDWILDPDGNTKSALEMLQLSRDDSGQYMEALQSTVLERRMNIFTTSGEVVVLPFGSTGIDFAFAVNPDHLRYLESIRVNDKDVEPTKVLNDGDTVELHLANETNHKNFKHLWLSKAKSFPAKERLRKSIKHTTLQHRDGQVRELLEQELQKYKLSSTMLFSVKSLQKKVADALQKESFEEVLHQAANGLLPINSIIDAYRATIQTPDSLYIRLLVWLRLLPKSRKLHENGKAIDIQIFANDRPGLIHDITRCFADRTINIASFEVYALPKTRALYKVTLEVDDFDDFSDVYDALLQVRSVQKIVRKK